MTKKKKKIHKKKQNSFMQHLGVVLGGLIIALGIHFLVLDQSSIATQLKTNLREANSGVASQSSDLYFEQSSDTHILLKSSQPINEITKLSLSLTYNPEELDILSVSPLNSKTKILTIANVPGINTVILEWGKSEDIPAEGNLIEIEINKKMESKTELNILVDTIQFSDSESNSYSPTTSGIQF